MLLPVLKSGEEYLIRDDEKARRPFVFERTLKKRDVWFLVQCLRTTKNATAPRPIRATSAPNPGCVGVLVGVAVGT